MGIFGSLAPEDEEDPLASPALQTYLQQINQGGGLTHQMTPPMGLSPAAMPPTWSSAAPEAAAPETAPLGLTPPVMRRSQKQGASIGDVSQSAQYLTDPVANRNPNVYKPVSQIVDEAAARYSPEDPSLKQLFGVTRDDLWQMGKDRVGNAMPPFLGWKPGSTGRSQGGRVATPQNAQRLVDVMSEFDKRYPDMSNDMKAWYTMDPAFWNIAETEGLDSAIGKYNQFNNFTGIASTMSSPSTELNRGTAALMMANKGRFEDFAKYGNVPGKARAGMLDYPPEMMNVLGATAHSTNQVPSWRSYLATGEHGMQSPKVPAYIMASGVPETGFQTDWAVPDSHFARAIGLPDVRTGEMTAQSSLKMPEYQSIAPWYRDSVAGPLNMTPVQAQALQWNVYGPQTGVKAPLGVPKLEILSRNIMKRAAQTGIPPEVLRDQILRGQNHAALDVVPNGSMLG